jgi:hypothetical protein
MLGEPQSAADDLRYPLVAHAQHLGDLRHRQPVAVRAPDGVVAPRSQALGLLFELGLGCGVFLGERFEAALGLGGVALGASDRTIVCRIPARRLA